MEAVTIEGRGTTSIRSRDGAATVVVVSVLAAAVFLLMRAGTALPQPQFAGACQRLHDAGLMVTEKDWFCAKIPWTSHAAYAAASLLLAIGFVLPCAILAATGRRMTAFLPLLLAPVATYPGTLMSEPWWGSGTWAHGHATAIGMTLVVMAAPVAAVAFTTRDRRQEPISLSDVARVVATISCLAGAAAVVLLAHRIMDRHFAILGGGLNNWTIVPTGIAIFLFGAMLGTDRRWWPWSFAPTALLLSMGPSLALIIGPERLMDWSQFGLVVPLFAIGMAASAWRPLAHRLSARTAEGPAPSAPDVIDPSSIRPVVVLNAVALGLLAISLVAFRADPLPIQLGTGLPTFLGPRAQVEDVRTKLDLRQTVAAMDAYRAVHGSYEGFGDATADTVVIETASRSVARVAAVSGNGDAFCLQRTNAGLTYGRARSTDPYGGPADLADAVALCGSTPWTDAAVRPFPIATMCDGMDPTSSYLICRMSQALMTDTLRGAQKA